MSVKNLFLFSVCSVILFLVSCAGGIQVKETPGLAEAGGSEENPVVSGRGELLEYGIDPKTPGVVFVGTTVRFTAFAVFSDRPDMRIDVTDKITWENGPRFQKFETGTYTVIADFRPIGGELIYVNIKVVEE